MVDVILELMRFFDLSQPLFDGCPNCHVHPPVRLPRLRIIRPDGWRMEEFHMASHTGTHLDAPLHKMAGGASIDTYPLETFCGEQVIVDLTHSEAGHPIGPGGSGGGGCMLGEDSAAEYRLGATSAPRPMSGSIVRLGSRPQVLSGWWRMV